MWRYAAAVFVAVVVLSGCNSTYERAGELAARSEWSHAIVEYRKALAEHPGNIEYRQRLRRAELEAATYFLDRGAAFAADGRYDAAIAEFQLGLAAMPDHPRLLQVLNEAIARKEAEALYAEAQNFLEAKRPADARQQLERAIEIDPEFIRATQLLAKLNAEEKKQEREKLTLTSSKPVTLNFRQTDIRAAFEFLARSFGINAVFDEGIKPAPVTLFVKDATFEQAMQLLATTSKTFNKQIGTNTLLIIPDTKDKRSQYEDHLVRTFYLNNLKAKEAADALRLVLGVKKLSVSDSSNTVTVRDSRDVIDQAEKLMDSIDRRPAEIMLDVEILEINRTRAEQLGLDFGREIGVTFPKFVVSDSWRQAIRGGTVTLPATTLRYFKQDVQAKVLANPKVRTLNGKQAKVHIGDRVPLRAATIVDATGQTRTTFDYRDIGVKLTVEPTIHLDHNSTVKVVLEVSSLGQNVGTAAEPAFTIGTRNAETFMTLRDGETAILGGLIKDEERKNRIKLPGVGDVPLVGSLFTSHDDEKKRTDVLLTITPRVVRGWQIPAKSSLAFFSGSEQTYSSTPVVTASSAPLQLAAAGSVVTSSTPANTAGDTGSSVAPGNTVPDPGITPSPGDTAPPAGGIPTIAFSQGTYQMSIGQELEFRLIGTGLRDTTGAVFEVTYTPSTLSFVRGTPAVGGRVDGANGGRVRAELSYASPPPDGSMVASIVLRAEQSGVVYLAPSGPYVVRPDGSRASAQTRLARVVIQ